MDQTETYLNKILQKRLGSVPSFSKYGNTVTRVPKQQEKIQSMPTVFRKKHETVYRPSVMQSQVEMQYAQQPQVDDKKPTEKQRVQYLLISKRISEKHDEVVTPTVDITKYRKTENFQAPIEEIQSLELNEEKDFSLGFKEVKEEPKIQENKTDTKRRKKIFGK